MALGRRELLRLGTLFCGVSAAAFAGTRRWLEARASSPEVLARKPIDCSSDPAGPGGYGAPFAPPAYMGAGSRDTLHVPPPRAPRAAGMRAVSLIAVETTLEVAQGRNVTVWAYGGTVPGPILRATVGDELSIEFENRTRRAHNLHFHGSHDVMQDGIGRVEPGSSAHYRIEAGPVGVHPYHCHVPPYAKHIGRGLYGTLIVDPPEGRPAAHEFVLCLCGFDADGDGRNDVYAWNGVAGWYERYPLKVPVGDLVRLYIVNMVEYDALATFHLHAQTFDLYRSGTGLTPSERTDVVSLGPAERAIVEFRLPRRGRYMFHPHQSHMAERGAMGWIVAI
jgi:FtsP/CotA-like multicopper oxidase with cupredoxin domain